jgi:hypothetical protein
MCPRSFQRTGKIIEYRNLTPIGAQIPLALDMARSYSSFTLAGKRTLATTSPTSNHPDN